MRQLVDHTAPTDPERTALALLALAATFTLATTLSPGPARVVLVLPIALVLPGYSIVVAALGTAVDRATALAAATLASIAFYAFAALALHAVSLTLTARNAAVCVDLVVGAAAVTLVARFRRDGARRTAARDIAAGAARLAALFGLAALLAATTWAARRTFGTAKPAPFTAFSFGGRWQHLSRAPSLGAQRHLLVDVELENQTNRRSRYRIVPRLAGTPWRTREVVLGDGQRWLGSVDGAVPRRPCVQRLTIVLETVPAKRRITQLTLDVRRGVPACRGARR